MFDFKFPTGSDAVELHNQQANVCERLTGENVGSFEHFTSASEFHGIS